MAQANSINASTTGIVGNTGTAFTATAATQYNVIVGGATSSTLANIAPSATSGVPLVSGGASANPSYTTAVIAGGGTNATTFGTTQGVVVYNGTSLVNYAGPQLSTGGISTNTTQPAFHAYLSGNLTNTTGDGTDYTVVWDSESFDNGSNFASNTFTAPVQGRYLFMVYLAVIGLGAPNTSGTVRISTTGADYFFSQGNYAAMRELISGGDTLYVGGSVIANMATGNTCTAVLSVSGGTKIIGITGGLGRTWFSGALIC